MPKAYIVPGCGSTQEYLNIYECRVSAALDNVSLEDLIIFCGTKPEHELAKKLALRMDFRNIETLTQQNTFAEIKEALGITKSRNIEDVVVSIEFPHIFVAKYTAMLMNGDAGYISPFTSKSPQYWLREVISFVYTAMRFMGFTPENTMLYKATQILNTVEK